MREFLMQTALMQAHCLKVNNNGDLSEWPYTSVQDLVLDRGIEHHLERDPLTEEQFSYLTEVAAATTRVFEPKQCFDNAMMLVLHDREERMTFCEGYALTGAMIPVHHAWVLLDDRLVDLTRSLREEAVQEFLEGVPPQADLKDRVLGVVPEGWQYLGIEFQTEAVRQFVFAHEMTGSLIDNPREGFPMLKEERIGNSPIPDPTFIGKLYESANG